MKTNVTINGKHAVARKNARFKLFANAYIFLMLKYGSSNDGAEAAAKQMGISRATAFNWLKEPIVIKEMEKINEKMKEKYRGSAEKVLIRFDEIADGNIIDFYERDGDSIKLKNLLDIPDKCKFLKNIKQKQTITETTIDGVTTKTTVNYIELETYSRLDSNKNLAYYHNLINSKQNDNRNTVEKQDRVVIYLPDNGYGGPPPIKRVSFGQPKQVECEVVG